jgi:hypothetical protein
MADFKQSPFFKHLYNGIDGARQGGARIIVDAEDAATGSGKTSAAVALGQEVADFFGYDLQPEDGVLSAKNYYERWQAHPGEEQPSVIVLDELSGAGAANSRRAMSKTNVILSQTWEMMRTKRIVTICTSPHWGLVDSNLRRLADYRLHCSRTPIGYFQPYSVGAAFDDGEERTRKLGDRIKFPDMASRGHPLYESLAEKKQEVLHADSMQADSALATDGGEEQEDPEEARKSEKVAAAQRAREQGLTCDEAGDLVDRSQSWVSRNTEPPNGDS